MVYNFTKGLVLLAFIVLFTAVKAQEQQPARSSRFRPEVQVGVSAGGHLYNGRFIYRTGKSILLAGNIEVSPRIQLGLTAGAEKFEKELFLPVAFNFTGFLGKSESSTFLNTQVGYAAGFNNKIYSYTNYDYNGGWMFCQGLGYRFMMKKAAVMVSTGYKHQFASYSYFTDDHRIYKESDNFHLLYFRIGLQL